MSSTRKKAKSTLKEKTGVIVFARVMTTLIDLALAIMVVRLLSKTDFAIMGYVLMVHEIARNIAVLGFPDSIFYYFERVAKGARRALVAQTVGILFLSSTIAGLLILLLNTALPALLTQWPEASIGILQEFLPLLALVSILEIPTWPTTNILLASDRQKLAAWYEMGTSVMAFTALVVPLSLGYGLTVAIWALVGYAFVRFVGSFALLWGILPKKGALSEELSEEDQLSLLDSVSLRDQANFSIPLGISALVGRFNKYIDKFIVSIFLVNTAYAEYTVAANEVPIIKVIPLAVGSVLISRYVQFQLQEKKEELLALWYKGIEKVSLLVIPLTILFTVLASDLISLLFETDQTSYANSVLPFQLYNLIVLIRVTHYGSILQAFGDTKGVLYFSINLLVANLLLSIPLTIYFGIVGTAAGTLIANIYNWLLLLRRIGRHMELPFWKVLPFPFYGKVLILSILISGPLVLLKNVWLVDLGALQSILLVSILFLVTYVWLARSFKLITTEDWLSFKSWLGLSFLRS